jgi:plasmid stabilization system protein ParE
MGLKVFWSRTATKKLKEIFEYYSQVADSKVASEILSEIIKSTGNLELTPMMGAQELSLQNRNQEFRYLVTGNYKVIYFISVLKKRIVIATVFDTRQDPQKLDNI